MSKVFWNCCRTVWTDGGFGYPDAIEVCMDWVGPCHTFEPHTALRWRAAPDNFG
jgi:hypothetical protein